MHGLIDAANGVLWNDVLIALLLGAGNIPGVAVALTVGGAGAIFRMWMTALVGMSSAFVPELAHVLPADVWGEHGPLPQRAAPVEVVAEARVAVRES